MENPRELDADLVDAQETRRILDRLYGYEVSPVLWKKVMPKLSAGRVQSVATRLVVERERARMRFRVRRVLGHRGPVRADREPPTEGDPATFTATLVALDGSRIATGRDFDPETGKDPRRRRPPGRGPAPAGWPPGWTTPPSRSPGSRRSRTGAGRTRRS